MAERDTVVACLQRAPERETPRDGVTFIDGHEREQKLAWSEIHARTQRAAGALAAQGVKPGDFVVLILPTGPGFLDAFFGAQWLGAVPVPVYPPVRLGRLDEYYARTAAMLQAVQAAAVVTEPRIRRLLGQVVARYKPRLGLIDVDTLQQGAPRAAHPARPGDLAMVQFSSGTTVDPKAVALSHRAALANVEAILTQIPHQAADHPGGVSWLPLYHDMGLIGCVFPAVYHPGPLALIPPEQFLIRPALWLRALSRHRANVSPAPNFAYALCLERVRDEDLEDTDGHGTRADLSAWRLALNGAEPISPHMLRAFQQRFRRWGLRDDAIKPVYGLSEASLAVTFTPLDRTWRATRFSRAGLSQHRAEPDLDGAELVSVGLPLPGYGVAIRGPEGPDLPEGQVGAIHVSGPSLMEGYLNRDTSPIVDGWLDTGDLGFLWQGELYITGRAKDILILRGRNHAPQDVERAVDEVPGVRTGCAAAVAELSEDGERLLLFVEARDPRLTLAEECRAAVLAQTSLEPGLVVVLEPGTLPRTSSGKIRRSETLRQWQAGVLVPPQKVTPWMLAGAFAKSALGYLRS